MKLSIRILVLLSVYLSIPAPAPAMNKRDTIKPAAIDTFRYKYFTGSLFKTANQRDVYNLDGFQHYDFRGNLGNSGQAVTNYYAYQPVEHMGFRYFVNDFACYLVQEDSIRYFDAHQPYTKLFMVAGQNKEANFSFVHSQNVNKNLNFTASFKRIRSAGIYLRQSTNLTSFYISSNYKSPNRHYYLLANIIYNVDKPQVNGGLVNDSDATHATLGGNRAVFHVLLNGAQRRYRQRSFNMTQFFNIGYHPAINDSANIPAFCPTSAFSLSTKISDETLVYADQALDSGFYANHFYSKLVTHDSVYFYRIRNSIGWNTWEMKRSGMKRKLGVFINAENEIIRVNQLAGDTLLQNWIAHGGIFSYTDSSSQGRFKMNVEYGLAGYNAGNYRIDLYAARSFMSKKFLLGVDGVASASKPDFMSQVYSSNNFIWKTHFENEGINAANGFVRSGRYQLEAGAFLKHFEKPVYYTSQGLPWQDASGIDVTGAYAYKKIDLGKWSLINRITWQSVPGNEAIRFPEWVTEHSLYYHNSIKKILDYQIGFDVFYFSAFYAKAYMPATGQFYAQDQKMIGNYPYGDIFLNVQVRTVRVFIKYEHVNSGIPSYAFYLAPGYPAPDRAFKFGVSWIFNN
ncbi:MAG: putative porin [Bacteroidia bacterium]